MKKSLPIFWLLLLIFFTNNLSAQSSNVIDSSNCCDKTVTKILFDGKAPSPWAIDGSIKDWKTILGQPTGDPFVPFLPPRSSAFNWAKDGVHYLSYVTPCLPTDDKDHPIPERNVVMHASTSDKFNTFFYFRRQVNGDSINTFFYFVDVNNDGFMNYGEPVFYGTFNGQSISALNLGIYIPNRSINYVAGKGNSMGNYHADFGIVGDLFNYHMPGKVIKIFDSKSIRYLYKLKKNEVFSAALTENGYGVEFSIPWRFYRNWFKNERSLHNRDIFGFRCSLQAGGETYNKDYVVDDFNSCCNSISKSNNEQLTTSTSVTEQIPGLSYRIKITYNNPTNADELVSMVGYKLSGYEHFSIIPSNPPLGFIVYPDKNCNGRLEPSDTADVAPYLYILHSASLPGSFDTSNLPIEVKYEGTGPEIIVPARGSSCFLADITIPPNISVSNSTIEFNTDVFFYFGGVIDLCEGAGGRPINPIGTSQTSIGSTKTAVLLDTTTVLSKSAITNADNLKEKGKELEVSVFPNPSNGTATVLLQNSIGGVDIFVDDFMGRTIQQWNNFSSNKIQLVDLKKGIYLIRIHLQETGKETRKKLIVL